VPIKQQFLPLQYLANKEQFETALKIVVPTYNCIHPQLSLPVKTPSEVFAGKPLDINHYKKPFWKAKDIENDPKSPK
jgi:hypothetical protein